MKTPLGVLAFTVALVSPFTASAQDFSGAVTLGYSHRSLDVVPGFELKSNALTLDGQIDFKLDSGLTFGARYNSFNLNLANLPIDLKGNLIGLNVGYDVSENFSAGVFLEQSQIGADIGPMSISDAAGLQTMGIEGSYSTGNLEFGAFVAKSDITGALGGLIGAGGVSVDVTSFGLSAKYEANSDLLVGGTFMRTSADIGGPSYDIDYIGIAAVYGLNDTVNLFGGLSQTRQSDLEAKINTIAIGGSYDLSATAGFPLVASLELARTDLKVGLLPGLEPKSNSIRLGLTMPLGKGSVKAPLNSTADAILNPSHDVLSQTLMNF